MATWKKVVVSGSGVSQLLNDAGYVASVGGGIISSSAEGDAQGQIKLNGVNVDANNLGTNDTPQFVAIEVGNASDTTLSRVSAGLLAVEGNNLLRASGDSIVSSSAQISINSTSGTPLNVDKGGTGTNTLSSGQVLIGNGTAAVTTTAIGISDNNIVAIDSTTVADNEYARFTATGLESRTAGEVYSDITSGTNTVSGSEQIEDVVGAMLTGNTETGITVTYEDGDGTIDFVVAYGSSANTAVQGNTTATIAVTANELTLDAGASAQALGGGPSWTLGLADTITGNRTFSNNVTVGGNLTVNGTLVSVNTDNLNVEDQFILINSGSTGADTGIIFGGSGGTAQEGHAIYWETATSVFGYVQDLAWNATTANIDSKLGNIQTTTGANPVTAPTFQGVGTINVRTDDESIWIYS